VTTGVQDKVIEQLTEVYRNRQLVPPPLGPETAFDGSLGLESLDFAELIVRLEQVFGKDPFAEGSILEVKTIGDLAALYE
jgi:acyl carrier protein